MRWPWGCSARSRADESILADGEIVRSRSPDAVDQVLRDEREATVARKLRHTEEITYKP